MNLSARHIVSIATLLLTMATANPRTDYVSDAFDSQTFLMPKDISEQVNFGYRKAHRAANDIDIIVIHSCHSVETDSFNTEECINQFRRYHVSPHYLISRDGTVIKMVNESDIALHAGRSRLPGTSRTMLNNSSIGIEIINTKYSEPTYMQYRALYKLVSDICKRHPIRYVVRHSDIAPVRKDDPWCFDWQRFQDQLHDAIGYLQFPSPASEATAASK